MSATQSERGGEKGTCEICADSGVDFLGRDCRRCRPDPNRKPVPLGTVPHWITYDADKPCATDVIGRYNHTECIDGKVNPASWARTRPQAHGRQR